MEGGKECGDQSFELIIIDRFRYILVAAGGDGDGAMLCRVVSREGDDRKLPHARVRMPTQLACGAESVLDGHA